MPHTDTVVIGAGQAGLAMSRCLTDAGRDHVVLDRGRVAERWRNERWQSLRLLTPNWMTRLPGFGYAGPDPDGFLAKDELVAFLESYAASFAAPVHEDTTVVSVVSGAGAGYVVVTDRGTWRCANIVVATGAADVPHVPQLARNLAASVHQVIPTRYVDPSSLPPGGVLIVGASATGVQLAAELRGAGRDVVVAAGSHRRAPRRYRGMDIMWWLDRIGVLDRTVDDGADVHAARREPSTQLVAGRRDLDLGVLHRRGVRLAGRLVAVDGHRVTFADDLAATTAAADAHLARQLERIDAHIAATGLDAEVLTATRPRPVPVDGALSALDLRAEGVGSVVWATGYRRAYPWLHVPVVDGAGEIVHLRGVTAAPGLYVLGQRLQSRRRSHFIDGVGADAKAIAAHLTARTAYGARR